MITVTQDVHFTRGNAGRRKVAKGRAPVKPAPRVPRISKLMALAIRFDRMLREGTVANQTELAKLANVSQPRITQILNLNLLAPDIQEQLLSQLAQNRIVSTFRSILPLRIAAKTSGAAEGTSTPS